MSGIDQTFLSYRQRCEAGLTERMLAETKTQWVASIVIGNQMDIAETLGYAASDHMMAEIGERLGRWQKDPERILRYQEDRFLLILSPETAPQANQQDWEEAFLKLVRPKVSHQGIPIRVDAFYGLVKVDAAEMIDAGEVLRRGDVTVRRAMESDRNGTIFEAGMIRGGKDGIGLLGSLASAIDDDQLRLVLQPRIRTATRKVIGAEALLRWQHPEKGLVPPAAFILQAERTDLIHDLFTWTLKAAATTLRGWKEAGLDLMLSLNLAARNLDHPELKDLILEALKEGGVEPSKLELEITESAFIRHPEAACRQLQSIREAGIRIAIDDFGTGHTSLRYLSRLPAHVLKIDRSLVSDLKNCHRTREVFSKIVSLAHSLKMEVVGEGVEDEHTFGYLKHLRCDQAQGFFISPPVDQQRFLQVSF